MANLSYHTPVNDLVNLVHALEGKSAMAPPAANFAGGNSHANYFVVLPLAWLASPKAGKLVVLLTSLVIISVLIAPSCSVVINDRKETDCHQAGCLVGKDDKYQGMGVNKQSPTDSVCKKLGCYSSIKALRCTVRLAVLCPRYANTTTRCKVIDSTRTFWYSEYCTDLMTSIYKTGCIRVSLPEKVCPAVRPILNTLTGGKWVKQEIIEAIMRQHPNFLKAHVSLDYQRPTPMVCRYTHPIKNFALRAKESDLNPPKGDVVIFRPAKRKYESIVQSVAMYSMKCHAKETFWGVHTYNYDTTPVEPTNCQCCYDNTEGHFESAGKKIKKFKDSYHVCGSTKPVCEYTYCASVTTTRNKCVCRRGVLSAGYNTSLESSLGPLDGAVYNEGSFKAPNQNYYTWETIVNVTYSNEYYGTSKCDITDGYVDCDNPAAAFYFKSAVSIATVISKSLGATVPMLRGKKCMVSMTGYYVCFSKAFSTKYDKGPTGRIKRALPRRHRRSNVPVYQDQYVPFTQHVMLKISSFESSFDTVAKRLELRDRIMIGIIHQAPRMPVRYWLKFAYIDAVTTPVGISLYPCYPVSAVRVARRPYCFTGIPLSYMSPLKKADNSKPETSIGFLDPVTNIIHRDGVRIGCQARPLYFSLGSDALYYYYNNTVTNADTTHDTLTLDDDVKSYTYNFHQPDQIYTREELATIDTSKLRDKYLENVIDPGNKQSAAYQQSQPPTYTDSNGLEEIGSKLKAASSFDLKTKVMSEVGASLGPAAFVTSTGHIAYKLVAYRMSARVA